MTRPIVTLDGPSGCGKSTAAAALAKRLGYLYLDTGAMYRAVALKSLRQRVPLHDHRRLAALARGACVELGLQDGEGFVRLDGRDVTQTIRTEAVAARASEIAVIPAVRRALVAQQRRMGRAGGVVADGRDTGTVVFRNAPWKFYVTASVGVRARRRWRELRAAGSRLTYTQVVAQTKVRDRRDSTRADSPLRRARGAWIVDTTHRTPPQTLTMLLMYLKRHPVR